MKSTLILITTYCGCLIGSGFATGKEIQVYFTAENRFGLLSVLISTLMFCVLFFIDSFNQYHDNIFVQNSKQERRQNVALTCLKLIYLLCMVSVFLAGISTLLSHYFCLKYIISVAGVMLVFMCFALLDIKAAANLNLIITSIIVSAMFLLSINYISTRNVVFWDRADIKFDFKQVAKGWVYVSYNVILPLSFSNAVLKPKKNDACYLLKNFIFNILPACLILGVLLIFVALCISASGNLSEKSEMPFVTIASLFGDNILNIYSSILLSTMFVSAITTYYSLIAEVNNLLYNNAKIKPVSKLIFALLCGLLSCIGFANFIEKIYPLLAVIGAVIIFISIKRFISILLIVKRKKCII